MGKIFGIIGKILSILGSGLLLKYLCHYSSWNHNHMGNYVGILEAYTNNLHSMDFNLILFCLLIKVICYLKCPCS